jgi:hypothetical protein
LYGGVFLVHDSLARATASGPLLWTPLRGGFDNLGLMATHGYGDCEKGGKISR